MLCDFTSENKEEKTNRHLNPNCRPFFAVCIREVSSKKTKDFFGVYRYFAGADSEYWHGAWKKSFLVGVWRVYFSHHSQNPAPWFAADGCILGIRRGWGVREIGAAALPLSVPSPLSFSQPSRPCLGLGGGAPKPPGAVSSDRRRCLWVFWGFCSFKARSGQTAQPWARRAAMRAARSLTGARRRLKNQIFRSQPPASGGG